MDWYDILMIAVLAGATLLGAWKGMAWQLASLASLVLSYFLALRFSTQLAPMFGSTAPWNRFVAMLVIYLATSVVVWLSFRMVAGFLDQIKLRDFDHQVGGLFGLVKGVLLCLVVTFFALGLSADLREHIIASKSGHCIALLLNKAEMVMPPEIHQVVEPYVNKLEERLNPKEPFQPNAPLPNPVGIENVAPFDSAPPTQSPPQQAVWPNAARR